MNTKNFEINLSRLNRTVEFLNTIDFNNLDKLGYLEVAVGLGDIIRYAKELDVFVKDLQELKGDLDNEYK